MSTPCQSPLLLTLLSPFLKCSRSLTSLHPFFPFWAFSLGNSLFTLKSYSLPALTVSQAPRSVFQASLGIPAECFQKGTISVFLSKWLRIRSRSRLFFLSWGAYQLLLISPSYSSQLSPDTILLHRCCPCLSIFEMEYLNFLPGFPAPTTDTSTLISLKLPYSCLCFYIASSLPGSHLLLSLHVTCPLTICPWDLAN